MFKLLKLLIFLVLALVLDLFLYGFTSACAACTSFSQFLTSPASLAGPILASLTVFLTKTKK